MESVLRKIYRSFRSMLSDIKHRRWRKRLTQDDFTIISHNCWGGTLYQYLNLEYKTPTVGLIIFPEDYLKFCSNLKTYLAGELQFIDIKDSKHFDRFVQNGVQMYDFPVAILNDIEIYFMHYHSAEEAREKWERRKKRVNYDKILFKLSERDGLTKDTLYAFSQMPGKKIIFTQKKYEDIPDAVFVKDLAEVDRIGASEVGVTLKKCNVEKLINSI